MATTIRRRRACLADWDGTLRQGYTIQQWIPFLVQELGLPKCHVSKLNTVFDSYQNKQISYEELVDKAATVYAEAIAGIAVADVRSAAEKFADTDAHLFSFTRTLLSIVRSRDVDIIIVSGGPQEVIEAHASKLGIKCVMALQVESSPFGRFEKRVKLNYGAAIDKRRAIKQLEGAYDISLAIGNSISDAPLLNSARHGFFILDPDSDSIVSSRHPQLAGASIHFVHPGEVGLAERIALAA